MKFATLAFLAAAASVQASVVAYVPLDSNGDEVINSIVPTTTNNVVFGLPGATPHTGTAAQFKGYKTHLFEGGIRSSLIAWGPGLMPKVSHGSRNKGSVFSAIDLNVSLYQLAGAQPAKGVKFDGENVLDTLLGKGTQSRKAPIFWSRPPDRKNFYGFKEIRMTSDNKQDNGKKL